MAVEAGRPAAIAAADAAGAATDAAATAAPATAIAATGTAETSVSDTQAGLLADVCRSDGAVEERIRAAAAAADECWEWEGCCTGPFGPDQDCASCSPLLMPSGVSDPLLHAGAFACLSAGVV